jgi:hypothetical protein
VWYAAPKSEVESPKKFTLQFPVRLFPLFHLLRVVLTLLCPYSSFRIHSDTMASRLTECSPSSLLERIAGSMMSLR